MKALIPLFILISTTTYSQSLKDKLQGDWVCKGITDSAGNPAGGKFGGSNEYLKFSFEKKYLLITEVPYDPGFPIPLKYGSDYIDLFDGAVYEIPERIYNVKSVDSEKLILTTKNKTGGQIIYHFINQKKLLHELTKGDKIIDNGLVVIKYINFLKYNTNRTSAESFVGSNEENPYPAPIFTDSKYFTFSYYLSSNIDFPKKYMTDSISDELVIDFDVSDKGVTNIEVVKGLSKELNEPLFRIIEKSAKKWEPVKVEGHAIKTRVRFHFIYYLATYENIINIGNTLRLRP